MVCMIYHHYHHHLHHQSDIMRHVCHLRMHSKPHKEHTFIKTGYLKIKKPLLDFFSVKYNDF